MQKILIGVTLGESMRAEFDSWLIEDGDEVEKAARQHKTTIMKVPVGFIRNGQNFNLPLTPLHALGLHWRLLAPPKEIQYTSKIKGYEWWFVVD